MDCIVQSQSFHRGPANLRVPSDALAASGLAFQMIDLQSDGDMSLLTQAIAAAAARVRGNLFAELRRNGRFAHRATNSEISTPCL
jgi:hypothetical protein